MVLYVLTFLCGLVINYMPSRQYILAQKIYILWLYIFLCFGYMVGTDWRNYENIFNKSTNEELLNTTYERGFYFLIYLIRSVITDFWLFLGIIKCIYFYCFLKFVKSLIGPRYLLVVALSLHYSLTFMLIDNPLRFMVGGIFLLIGFMFLIKGDYKKFVFISIFGVFFHISLIVPILLGLLGLKKDWILGLSKKMFIFIYFICVILSIIPEIFNNLFASIIIYFPFLSNKLENTYYAEAATGIFSLGSFIMVFFFILIIRFKANILAQRNGDIIFTYSLIYMFFIRVFMVIPTGIRFTILLSTFFVVSLVYLVDVTKIVRVLVIFTLVLGSYIKGLFATYQFIPYTNSIYYILTDHLNYSYRSNYNKNEYYKRTGKYVEEYKFELRKKR